MPAPASAAPPPSSWEAPWPTCSTSSTKTRRCSITRPSKRPPSSKPPSPNGRQKHAQATLLTAELLLERAANAATTHAAALGADFDAARYTGFPAAFLAGRKGTGEGDQQTAKARAAVQHHRDDLTHRITDAVKLVAAQFPRDEARAAAYFPVGLLQAPEAAAPATKAA
ncbi:hypothetical protein [Hymenobacter ruricola]|uniref:Uncharacterized protein n=1 Tax=Hymenobacter ruricola TaxID=2791023 RepID=A0ABS0I3D0_9BACT|nr:hypothetical protein [Hymenobacter ruricola]MBF9221457.1 hypothetical protein [Hymenobacter ruricola]